MRTGALQRGCRVASALVAMLALRVDGHATTIDIDVAAQRHPIDARIYGTAFADTAQLQALNAPLNRQGGNTTTRYNWEQNADNKGLDWYFESLSRPGTAPGAFADTFISDTRAAGAESMLTIPMIEWVAALGSGRTRRCSFSITKYGVQTDNDWQWFPDAGNGVLSGTGQRITGNDPTDANVPSDVTFQRGWVEHLTNTWGLSGAGGLQYYLLDNEPGLWHETHHDVRPVGVTMEEMRDKILAFGAMIKNADPNAIVLGPEPWGWTGYNMSGYDIQYSSIHGWGNTPDRDAHGGADLIPWLLQELSATNAATGRRLLDVLSIHYYPQGGEFSDTVTASMQLRRNRSTRSLWDTNYVDETWINDRVSLIPRLRNWVDTYYPGTDTAITEYNWGAESHINGATTQADILGIFGREGLDIATRWATPPADSPTFKAMQMYRNYDGTNSFFGDVSVATDGGNPDNLSAFAAQRSSDRALTVMVINKALSDSEPLTLSLTNFYAEGTATVRQLTAANRIAPLPDLSVTNGVLTTNVPAQSITLFVIPAAYDGDADGLPDAWEEEHFGDLSSTDGTPAQDSDGDGATDRNEYHAGTDPRDPDSALRIRSLTHSSVPYWRLSWSSVSNRTYRIQHTPDLLTPFTNLIIGFPGVPPLNVYTTRTELQPPRFFRVVVD